MGFFAGIAKWVIGLLVTVVGERLASFVKAQKEKMALAAIEKEKLAEMRRLDLIAIEKLKNAKTKEEEDAAANDILNNV